MYIPNTIFQGPSWGACKKLAAHALVEALRSMRWGDSPVWGRTEICDLVDVAVRYVPKGPMAVRSITLTSNEMAMQLLLELKSARWCFLNNLSVDFVAGRVSAAVLRAKVNRLLADLRNLADSRQHNRALASRSPDLPEFPGDEVAAKNEAEFAAIVSAWKCSDFARQFPSPPEADPDIVSEFFKAKQIKRIFLEGLVTVASSVSPQYSDFVSALGRGAILASVPTFLSALWNVERSNASDASIRRKQAAIAEAFAQHLLIVDWCAQVSSLGVDAITPHGLRKITELHRAIAVFTRCLRLPDEKLPSEARQWLEASAAAARRGRSDMARYAGNYLDVPFAALHEWSRLTPKWLGLLLSRCHADACLQVCEDFFHAVDWPDHDMKPKQKAGALENTDALMASMPDTISARLLWDEAGNIVGMLHRFSSRIVHDFRAAYERELASNPEKAHQLHFAKTKQTFELLLQYESADPNQSGERRAIREGGANDGDSDHRIVDHEVARIYRESEQAERCAATSTDPSNDADRVLASPGWDLDSELSPTDSDRTDDSALSEQAAEYEKELAKVPEFAVGGRRIDTRVYAHPDGDGVAEMEHDATALSFAAYVAEIESILDRAADTQGDGENLARSFVSRINASWPVRLNMMRRIFGDDWLPEGCEALGARLLRSAVTHETQYFPGLPSEEFLFAHSGLKRKDDFDDATTDAIAALRAMARERN